MDEHQFIAELVKAVTTLVSSFAWPAVTAWAVWLFHRKIIELLPNLRLKWKEAELSLSASIDKAEAEASTLSVVVSEGAATPIDSGIDPLKHPRGAMLAMRYELERAIRDRATRESVEVGNGRRDVWRLMRALSTSGKLPQQLIALLNDLRAIGNQVAHSDEMEITPELAERFIQLCRVAIAQLGEEGH